MRAAYALFSGESDELELARQMKIGTADLPVGSSGNKPAALAPYFYANLYLGLFAEAKGDAELARRCTLKTGERGLSEPINQPESTWIWIKRKHRQP